MIQKLTKLGWLVVELAFMLVVLCVLLSLILGKEGGGFVSSVAANTLDLLQKVPSGTVLGVFLILVLYWTFRRREVR
jgi:NhaP-type Na+/H+ or K+/H+ antiporter